MIKKLISNLKNKNKRPLGMTIFAAVQILIGLAILVWGIPPQITNFPFGYISIFSLVTSIIFIFLLSSVFLFSGMALFKLYSFGRGLVLTFAGVNLLFVFTIFIVLVRDFDLSFFIWLVFGLIYSISIIIYFLRKEIKNLFKKENENYKNYLILFLSYVILHLISLFLAYSESIKYPLEDTGFLLFHMIHSFLWIGFNIYNIFLLISLIKRKVSMKLILLSLSEPMLFLGVQILDSFTDMVSIIVFLIIRVAQLIFIIHLLKTNET